MAKKNAPKKDEKLPLAIEFHEVWKRYDAKTALSEVNLQIPAGEMVFLTGHSGAGKSTILRLISVLERPTRGKVLIHGKDTHNITPETLSQFRQQFGLVFQDHRLLSDRTVFDNVALPLQIRQMSEQDMGRRVRAALDLVGLAHLAAQNPRILSAGEQQRVGIARAIVAKPSILLADEPTGNLDSRMGLDIMNLFARFNDAGSTVLIVTHNQELVDAMQKRVICLDEGKVV